jgi:hypothetical protein
MARPARRTRAEAGPFTIQGSHDRRRRGHPIRVGFRFPFVLEVHHIGKHADWRDQIKGKLADGCTKCTEMSIIAVE